MTGNFRRFLPKAAVAALSAILLAAAVPAAIGYSTVSITAAAEADTSVRQHSTFRIVGIGDSLTAGYEHGFTLDSVPYGYVERVFEQALFRGRAEYANYGVLGLKLEGLQNWLAAAEQQKPAEASSIQDGLAEYPLASETIAKTAKLRGDLQQADLVVMTIGSNDFSALFEVIPEGRDASDAWLDPAIERYESALTASLRSIYALQPKAQVVVSDIFSPIANEKIVLGVLDFTEDDYQYFIDSTVKVRERLEKIADRFAGEGYSLGIAYTGEQFVGKEGRYTSIRGGDPHPNQAGYAVIGDAFAKAVWGEIHTVQARPAGVGISVVVNGQEIVNDNKPVLKDNRTYLAFRDIADAMEATTKWDNQSKTVTITLDGNSVALTIGSSTMLVNGHAVTIDTPPFLHTVGKEQKTYVPLAVLADGLGFQVEYRGKLKTAFINK
ncbi:stalk domain-containing protein [Paenibacillus tarimensis]